MAHANRRACSPCSMYVYYIPAWGNIWRIVVKLYSQIENANGAISRYLPCDIRVQDIVIRFVVDEIGGSENTSVKALNV